MIIALCSYLLSQIEETKNNKLKYFYSILHLPIWLPLLVLCVDSSSSVILFQPKQLPIGQIYW